MERNILKLKAGFNLVELIAAVVVTGILMYALIAIFITAGAKGVNVEAFTVAQLLASGKLEETMSADFADISSEAEVNFSGDLSNYSCDIVVDYVSSEALDTVVGYATPYKRVNVRVRSYLLGNPISFRALKVDY